MLAFFLQLVFGSLPVNTDSVSVIGSEAKSVANTEAKSVANTETCNAPSAGKPIAVEPKEQLTPDILIEQANEQRRYYLEQADSCIKPALNCSHYIIGCESCFRGDEKASTGKMITNFCDFILECPCGCIVISAIEAEAEYNKTIASEKKDCENISTCMFWYSAFALNLVLSPAIICTGCATIPLVCICAHCYNCPEDHGADRYSE